jgi:hypothetical protein
MVWSEASLWSQTAEKMLNAFDRKVPRKICGAVIVNGQWRNRYKHESNKLYN